MLRVMADAVDKSLGGDSAEQRAAEAIMIDALATELGVAIKKKRIVGVGGAWAEIDGVSDDSGTLVEAWAHQGPPKSAQKAKVMTDALKLAWVEGTRLPGARKILLLSDEVAAKHFRGSSWMAAALAHFGIEVLVVELPASVQADVRAAQRRQFR